MLCPKCKSNALTSLNKFRWRCDGCTFMCGASFFFDDEEIAIKLEVGLPIHKLTLSQRAQALMDNNVLSLDELQMAINIAKLPEIKRAEAREDELQELAAMMEEVVGGQANVLEDRAHRYRYRKAGGIVSRKLA